MHRESWIDTKMGDEEILAEEYRRLGADHYAAMVAAGEPPVQVQAALVAMSRVRASLPEPTVGSTGEEPLTPDEAWQNLCDVDDRNSPAEYPDMCLITREELARFMSCASTPAQSVLVEALHKISNPFDHGHCGTCGKECAGATDCDCSFPVWEQDNPIAIAKAALSHAPFQPAPVVDADDTPANVDRMAEAGFVTWASTEEGGGPDVGITVGLGHDLGHLWLGEITRDRWEDVGGKDFSDNDMGHWLIHYAPGKEPDVLAKALQPDHDPLREFLEHTLAPMLRASPQPDRESDAGPLLAALIEISNFPYAGAPDIQMRKIARAAVERFTSSNRPQATEGEG